MKKFQVLGDPHLGRSFVHGVPLARRGEREEIVWKQFEKELNNLSKDIELHVNMGDLFDKAIVSYDVILRAASIYNEAAKAHPKVSFVVLKGNHDLLRDLERSSAFDLFTKLVTEPNITVVTKPTILDDYVFFAYDPINDAADLVTDEMKGCKIAFGHWDTEGFGNDHNVIPTSELNSVGIKVAYTGHVHKTNRFKRDNVDVHVVGSMQPYAHGEETKSDLYITLTLKQLAENKKNLTNRCVRVVLEPGELLEQEIDCLQLTVKRKTSDDDEGPEVTLGDFNMVDLFEQAFKEAGVRDDLKKQMIEQYDEERISV